jgi:aspartate/methionine/tyrosine aminotransferase
LLFDSAAVNALTSVCAEREIYLLADEIFFLLSDYRLGTWTPSYVSFGSALTCPVRSRFLFLTDGTSKAFAAGGLRCGFMVCPDHSWASAIASSLAVPPKSILRAWDNIYSAFLDEAPHGMMDLEAAKAEVHTYLFETRRQLSVNRDEILSLAREFGIDDGIDTPYRGGLFVLAKLSDRREALARKVKLLLNSDKWGRTPGWNRICFSLPPERWSEAQSRLRAYLNSVTNRKGGQ